MHVHLHDRRRCDVFAEDHLCLVRRLVRRGRRLDPPQDGSIVGGCAPSLGSCQHRCCSVLCGLASLHDDRHGRPNIPFSRRRNRFVLGRCEDETEAAGHKRLGIGLHRCPRTSDAETRLVALPYRGRAKDRLDSGEGKTTHLDF